MTRQQSTLMWPLAKISPLSAPHCQHDPSRKSVVCTTVSKAVNCSRRITAHIFRLTIHSEAFMVSLISHRLYLKQTDASEQAARAGWLLTNSHLAEGRHYICQGKEKKKSRMGWIILSYIKRTQRLLKNSFDIKLAWRGNLLLQDPCIILILDEKIKLKIKSNKKKPKTLRYCCKEKTIYSEF